MRRSRWSPEERLILQLSGGSMDFRWIHADVSQSPFEWVRLHKTAQRQGVAALVLDRLLQIPLPASSKSFLQHAAKKEIVAVMHDNLVFKRELARILEPLHGRGIECILLKGLSLNYSQLRPMGDIDLMVPPDRLAEAIDAILVLDGYHFRRMQKEGPDFSRVYSGRLPERERRLVPRHISWNNEFQVFNPSLGVLVELHHAPLQIRNPDKRFMEDIQGVLDHLAQFWQEKRFDVELGCHVLAPEHSLLLMCLRNSIKQPPANSSFRLSNLVDISNLVGNGIDWRRFLQHCVQMRIAPHALFSLDLSQRLLGTPVPDSILRDLKTQCTSRQLRAVSLHRHCVTSLRSGSILYSKLYKAISPGAFGGTFMEQVKGVLFLQFWLPSRARMAGFYRLPLGSPWIALAYLANPVRWVRRILEKLFT